MLSAALNLAAPYPQEMHPHVERFATRSWETLPRYLASPLHAPTEEAFADASEWLRDGDAAAGSRRPLILDSGCGTGRSTCALARAHPEAAVLGVDRSEARLSKAAGAAGTLTDAARGRELALPPNALLVRAELASFWRLMLQQDAADPRDGLAASRVRRHLLLYPNPYPKPARLNRRWHGHPSLPVLLALGGTLEVRSNWRVYLKELQAATLHVAAAAGHGSRARAGAASYLPVAAAMCGERIRVRGTAMRARAADAAAALELLPPLAHEDDALTLFELKFHRAGEALHRLRLPDWQRHTDSCR